MALLAPIADGGGPALTVASHDWTAWPTLTRTWASIAQACPGAPFFLMPASVEVWLQTFGVRLQPELLVFKDRGQDVGACVLVRRVDRKGPFFVRRVYLNTAGEDEADSVCIEYNDLLCRPGFELRMAHALKAHVDARRWDELHAPGMTDGPGLHALRVVFGAAHVFDDAKASYHVDLEALRRDGTALVDRLSRRERAHYRQNTRKYAAIGELRVEVATTTAEALVFLDALAALHQRTWTSRGKPGAFASATFDAYHRRLIARWFPLGGIELLRLRAGTATVGYHYSLVHRGRSYFYQCGYDYDLARKLSPGIVVHGFAIHRAVEHGRVDYEFMAGDAEYKRRLGTGVRRMHWIAWQAPTLKMRAFDLARRARRSARDHTRQAGAAVSRMLRPLVRGARAWG